MKRISFYLLLFVSIATMAQGSGDVVDMKPHKIVMQFSVGDSLEQASIVGQLRNIRTAWPNATIEVVAHSSGLDMLMTSKSKVGNLITHLSEEGVVFAACNNTMRRRGVKKEDLLPVARVVPSAMIELVTKQEEGWSYLKGAH